MKAGRAAITLMLPVALSACTGTTGGDLISFDAYGAGPADAAAGQPYSFENSRGFAVTLTRARLHVGAVYLNRSRPNSVDSDPRCQLSGIYLAEVTSGLDIDVLSPELQPFPEEGFATTERAPTAEVWLFGGGDINEPDDHTVILDVKGTARGTGPDIPFEGKITIGQNRQIPPLSPAKPGANPICKQRIVSPIKVDIEMAAGDSLVLRVDPRGLFANVDFAELAPEEPSSLHRFRDDGDDAPSRNLYLGLRAAAGTYSLELRGRP